MTEFRALPTQDLVRLMRAASAAQPGFIETVVDGGAGIGDTVQPVLDAVPGARVFAYEPLPENLTVLQQRFADNPAVSVRPVAIGDAAGQAVFRIPSRVAHDSGAWAAGTSYNGYLEVPGLRERVKYAVKATLAALRRTGATSLPVTVVRLDEDLDGSPDVVKLDLQGAEPPALAGLGDYLASTKAVQVEVQLLHDRRRDPAAIEALHAAGFDTYVADCQFGVPDLTPDLREALEAAGVEVLKEFTGSEFGSQTLVLGAWRPGCALPFDGLDLAPGFEAALHRAHVEYFQTDVVALNSRFPEWSSILESVDAAT